MSRDCVSRDYTSSCLLLHRGWRSSERSGEELSNSQFRWWICCCFTLTTRVHMFLSATTWVHCGPSHWMWSSPRIFSTTSGAGEIDEAGEERSCGVSKHGHCRVAGSNLCMAWVMHLQHTNLWQGISTGWSTIHWQIAHWRSHRDMLDAGRRNATGLVAAMLSSLVGLTQRCQRVSDCCCCLASPGSCVPSWGAPLAADFQTNCKLSNQWLYVVTTGGLWRHSARVSPTLCTSLHLHSKCCRTREDGFPPHLLMSQPQTPPATAYQIYSVLVLGIHKLEKIVRNFCIAAGFQGYFTNLHWYNQHMWTPY